MIEFKPLAITENEACLIDLLSENQVEVKKVPVEENRVFSLALYDGNQYIGGITANKWMNATHISLLALSKSYRHQGYGTQLLKKPKLLLNKKAQRLSQSILKIIKQKHSMKNRAITFLDN